MSQEADNVGDHITNVLPAEIVEQIPVACLKCPKLLWKLKVYQDMNSRAQRLMNSWSPLSRLIGKLENLEDKGFFKEGVHKLITEMQDCAGPIPNSELGMTVRPDIQESWPEAAEIFSNQCGMDIRDNFEI